MEPPPACPLAADGAQRPGQKALQPGVVGRHPGTQGTVPVKQPVAATQDAAGRAVRLDDATAPVEQDGTGPGMVEQCNDRGAQDVGPGQGPAHPDELADMGQKPLDHVDFSRPPAARRDAAPKAPHDARAVRPVRAVLTAEPAHPFVIHQRGSQLLLAI